MSLINADEAEAYAKSLGLTLKEIKKYKPYSELTSGEKQKNPKQGKSVKGGSVHKEIIDAIAEIRGKFLENGLPDIRITGGNDFYHRGLSYQSNHTLGRGIDAVFNKSVSDNQLKEAEEIIFNVIATGKYDNALEGGTRLGFINEYKRKTSAGTGNHLHFSVASSSSKECIYPLIDINNFEEFDARKAKNPPTEDGNPSGETVGSAPVDLRSISFSNANDVDEFFKKYNSGGFVDWFNNLRHKFLKKGRPLNAIKDKKNWQKFWNLIPITFDKESINIAEFLTVTNIVCIETGSAYFPKTERVGTSGHPGIAYAFDKVKGLKSSYNTLSGNVNAFDLFNDPDYLSAHGNRTLSNKLRKTTDVRWKGDAFPVGFSGNSNKEIAKDGKTNGFIIEADFMKFRGRGFIQSTGRGKYTDLVDFVKEYKGNNSTILKYKKKWGTQTNRKILTQSTNKDWDNLFQDTDSIIPSFAVNQFSKSRSNLYHINISSDKTINDDTFNAGWRTNGAKAYGEDVKAMVNVQMSELAIAPSSPSSGTPFSDGSTGGGGSNTQNRDYSDSTGDNGYPSDLPKVEGLTNFFRPTIKLEPINFELPAGEERKKEVASTIGYQPFVWYLAYQLRFIKSLILSSKGLLPTIKLVFTDTLNLMTDDGFPLDDSKIKVFLNSRTPSLRPIFMEFKIVNFSRGINNTFTIDGVCNVNKFFLREFESYADMTSFECMQEFARRAELGFNSNVGESDDRMSWINPGKRGMEFVKDVIGSSYRSDESFIWCYVDFYYNINYIDVEEALKIDITDQIQVKNTGLESINQVTNNKEETNRLWLSNDPSMDQTNQYFSDWKIINNSTSISLFNGYLNKAKFYDINDKNYLIFDIDSITSEGDKTIIMKGSPQDMEFYNSHVRPTYVGKLDTDNMHDNFNYSIIQNEQNINDLQKIGVTIKLDQPNYNLYRYQKIKVVFSGAVSTPSASQINNRLSGEWLIIDIEHTLVKGELNQKITLIRRELDLSPEELQKERQNPKSESNQNNSNNSNPENEVPIDTTGEQIEVAPDNELIPFSYDLRFTNANDIDDFFDQYNIQGFVGWFADEFGNDTDFVSLEDAQIVSDDGQLFGESGEVLTGNDNGGIGTPINKQNWSKIWNSAVDLVYNDNRQGNSTAEVKDFNIVEFLSLNTMIYFLNGTNFVPKTDNRTMVDLFRSNNNLDGNETAYDLFNDENYISLFDNKTFAPILSNTTDVSWQGTSFPVGFSGTASTFEKETSKDNNEFITNADFFKFRNRGLVKSNGRHDYGLVINFINNYKGSNTVVNNYKDMWSTETQIVKTLNASKETDWKSLIETTDLVIPTVAMGNVMYDLKKVHIIPTEGRNEQKIFNSIQNVGKLVESALENPDPNFVDKFVKMVRKQINFLNSKELIPAKEEVPEQIGEHELDLIPGEYVDNNGNKLKLCQIDGSAVNVKIADAYLTMREAAAKDGIKLKVNSAFRSPYDTIDTKSASGVKVRASSQKYLYDGYKAGKAGFNLAAAPGKSNHGNGIGLDLNTGGKSSKRFHNVNRKIYTWLVKNSWKYGFVRAVRKEEWHYDHLPSKAEKGPYGKLSGTDANKFYTDWGLDNLA